MSPPFFSSAKFITNTLRSVVARCRICSIISSTTYFVICDRFICYWAKSFAAKDTKYRFPVTSVRGAEPVYVIAPRVFGLRLQIHGQHDLVFEFNSRELRDEALTKLVAIAAGNKAHDGVASPLSPLSPQSMMSPQSFTTPTPTADSEPQTPILERAVSMPKTKSIDTRNSTEIAAHTPSLFSPLSRTYELARQTHIPPSLVSRLPKPINLPASTLAHIPSKHFVCLTIGSRGDVQPYIALALGLMAEGHKVTIVTHEEYKAWCEGWGVAHRTAGGDPGALMKLSVETKVILCVVAMR